MAFLRSGGQHVDIYTLQSGSPTLATTVPSFLGAVDLTSNFQNMNTDSYVGVGLTNTEAVSYVDGGVLAMDVVPMQQGGGALGMCAGVLLENSGGTFRLGAFAKPDLGAGTAMYWASQEAQNLNLTSSSNLGYAFACNQTTGDSLQGF